MAFVVAADYDRFMGRYSVPLAVSFADWAGVQPGQRVLDVGCGPGALTARLVEVVGAEQVSAVDPSPPFVAAARERHPGVEVVTAGAERLPHGDGTFDVVLAQLVVHFMTDPVAGLREMGRVTRGGGTVAACVWDLAGGGGPLSLFWRAAHDVDPGAPDESLRPGVREGDLGRLCRDARLDTIVSGSISVTVRHPSFEQWWEPYTLGIGPAGDHVAHLDEAGRTMLRERCRELLPSAPFDVSATAWAVRATS
ncbi:SAM-dependent methyltransferase [Humibacillus sp. DSM 29435]|uniref:class I SAM-dependent methyltransferase n=1 Tax=Humibacillus sp. DSM 29435 TaxID=1869167 RepID=UPI00087239D0|nr:class I SAM-dependent methyltransferase [Humibacillus sp. DSM 29435]OFE18682.1 SAM-dependent methyltransferase [Humibacillus sp. DSM 29435]